jgi:hypothetical protein
MIWEGVVVHGGLAPQRHRRDGRTVAPRAWRVA